MPLLLPEIDVTIRNLAFGAGGVGDITAQSDNNDDLVGMAAFVPFSIPGEKVRAQVTERKKKHAHARLSKILEPSAERIEPACPHFETCGGCELQHINYEAQLVFKYKLIRGSMLAASIPAETVEKLRPIHKSSPFAYRRRVTLHIDTAGNVGFYRTNSRIVVPVEKCPIASKGINEILPLVSSFVNEHKGILSSVLVENDSAGSVIVLKSPHGLTSSQIQKLEKSARVYFQNVLISAEGKEVGGFGRQILQLPLSRTAPLELNVPAGYFSQVNWDINLTLIEKTVAAVAPRKDARVLDLYSGAGNFSLPIARTGCQVIGVESDKRLATLARDNFRKYKLEKNATVLTSSVEHFLKSKEAKSDFDAVVADPPRSGLGALVHTIPKTKKLVYISCSLPSFVRDLKTLLAQGWDVDFIEPHDMFAQTTYVEILTSLTKK